MNPPDVAMHNNESQARGPAVLKMKGQASTIGTFMNNVVFSSFWLSAPYAFAETGWVLGIIFLTVTLTTSWVTGLMYGRLVNDRYQELLDHRNRELESRPPGNNRGVAPKVKGSPKEMDPETTPNGAVNLCSSTEFSKAPEDGIGTMATRASEFSTGAAQSHEVDEEVTLSAMYADALGARVGPIIGDFICILNFVPASAGEMILCGQLLELLFPDVMEIGYWILIVGLYSFFAYMIPNLETLEKASWLFGIFLISSAVFMITGTVLSIKANDPVTSSEYGGQDALSIFNGLGVFAFIFGGHSTYPTQISEMKRPHDWNKLFPYCWAIVALILFSTGIVGFLGYGSATKDIIFLSMAPDNGISTTAAVFFLLYGLYTIPLWINVLFQTFERRWGIPTHTHRGERVCMCGLSLNPFVARLMFRTSILAAQLTIALAIPYSFGYLQALVGSCAIALGTFILPAIMYRHFKRKQLGMRSLGGLYFIMLVGGVILVCGTIVAIINIVNHISEYSLFGGF